jgi:UDP-GlcNAc:undecaprenyl-phosphate GlcNAc-1-phosphate transferase
MAWAVPLSGVTVALVSPWGRRFAWVVGAIDRPNDRKIHRRATPRLGGLSAAIAVVVCLALWFALDPTAPEQCRRHWGLLAGAAIMLTIGLFDDLFRLGPRVKLLFQFVAAGVICAGGIRVELLELPLVGSIHLGWFGAAASVVWIVGVTNALNFLDGLDGLAAGTAALASASFLLIAGPGGLTSMLGLMSAALIGACAMLVVHNVRSPKSFLGDSGSLLLGVLVASTGILASKDSGSGGTRLCLPCVVLAVPLIDMTACVVRRLLVGRSMFSADRGHIHHMLLSFGLSPNAAAAVLCGATAVFGIAAGIAAHGTAWAEAAAVFLVAVASTVVYWRFGCFSIKMWSRCRRANRIVAAMASRPWEKGLRAGCLRSGKQEGARSISPSAAGSCNIGGEGGTSPAGQDRETSREASDPLPERLRLVLDRIRRARRALGIDYIRVQRAGEGSPDARSASAILELGRKPDKVVTTHLYPDDRYGSGTLTVILGAGSVQRPARIRANELLMMPLLTELAAALERSRVARPGPEDDVGARNAAGLKAALSGN